MAEHHAIEHNGDCWQSVFPKTDAEKSQLHTTAAEALEYMMTECQVYQPITVYPFVPAPHEAL